MTQDNSKIRFPVWAVILDLFGTLFVVLGIYAQLGGEDLLFAEFLDIRPYGIVLILTGVLLMLPLVIFLVRRSTSRV
jgi:hypothetical protein